MQDLKNKHCVPCEEGGEALGPKKVEELMTQIQGWETEEYRKIFKNFRFKGFKEAMEFVNKVAAVAESEKHHPDIKISYNKVKIELWTHAARGLSYNDFILAAKVDKEYVECSV